MEVLHNFHPRSTILAYINLVNFAPDVITFILLFIRRAILIVLEVLVIIEVHPIIVIVGRIVLRQRLLLDIALDLR
jgi:hypothetical protein